MSNYAKIKINDIFDYYKFIILYLCAVDVYLELKILIFFFYIKYLNICIGIRKDAKDKSSNNLEC